MVIVGCKKDFTPQTADTQPINLEVKNGVIAFKDSESFEAAMRHFHSIGLEATHKLIRQLPNFKGLIEITPNDKEDIARLNKVVWKLEDEQIGVMNFDDEVHPDENLTCDDFLIQDPYYEAILNTYREVMIDNLVIRNTENGVFAYTQDGRQNFDAQYETPAFNQALTNIYTTDDMIGFQDMPIVLPDIYLINRDIELFDENPIIILSATCNGTKLKNNMFGQLQDCDNYIDNRRRFRYTIWA
jgi:hypothetical protein